MLLRQWLLLYAISLCITGCEHTTKEATRGENGAMDWAKTHSLRIVTQDPRGIGHGRYRMQVIPLAVLSSGKVVSPVVEVEYPRKGFMDRVYYEKRRQSPLLGIVSGTEIAVPLDGSIAKYLFLLRGLDEESDWRVFEFDERTAKGENVVIPDVLALPLLKNHENHDALWDEYQRADQHYEEARK